MLEFASSGETIARFCSRREISVATFGWWRSKLGSATRTVSPTRGARACDIKLLPVHVVGKRGASGHGGSNAIELALAGVEMRIAVGTDVAYVTALVASLRSRC